jgi:hypothetical protein
MALFVLAVVLGVSMTAINVIKARELAERTGEPPDRAAWRVFFARDQRAEVRNLELRAELRERTDALGAQGAAAGDDRPAAERLEELQELYRKGLVNEDEFAEKRREILGDV